MLKSLLKAGLVVAAGGLILNALHEAEEKRKGQSAMPVTPPHRPDTQGNAPQPEASAAPVSSVDTEQEKTTGETPNTVPAAEEETESAKKTAEPEKEEPADAALHEVKAQDAEEIKAASGEKSDEIR